MKILMVGDYPDDPRLGSTKVYYKLREEFIALGHQCDLLLKENLGGKGCPNQIRQGMSPLFAAQAVSRVFRKRGHYDAIDAASADGFIIGLQKRLGFYPHTGLVSRSHGLEHLNYQRMLDDHAAGLLYKPWTRRLWFPLVRLSQVAGAARLADRLIVLNSGDRDFALRRRWQPIDRIDTIPHGISSRYQSETSGEPGGKRGAGLLYCGSWTGMKGVDYLAPAFAKLVENGVKVNLTILAGYVPEMTIRAAFPPAAQPLLTVMDRVGEAEVIRQYQRHDALVFCSTYEGFGMVLLEAMSQALPAIATPVGCAPLLIRHEENGLIVPARDADKLSEAMKQMMTDAHLRKRLGQNACATARAYTWRETAIRTVETYRRARAG